MNFHPRHAKWMLGLLLLLISLVAAPSGADAHALLQTSTPANGDIVATEPSTVTATFTEHVEPSESTMELFDSTGRQVTGPKLSVSSDKYSMSLTMPASLPNGTYSVLWRTLSADDGHTAEGYFSFTIGSAADVSSVVAVPTDNVSSGPPQLVKTASRWAALVGFAAFIASWPIWTIVIRPSLAPIWQEGPRFARRARRYALIAFVVAIVGSLFALAIQALVIPDGSYFDKVMNTVGQTRYGRLWLFRVGLMMVEGLILSACAWWYVRHRKLEWAAAWLVLIAMPIPFSLIAHASAQPIGRDFSVVADVVHLLAAGIWVGGIFMLAFVFFPGLRGIDPLKRREVLIVAIPRFSLIAMIAWSVLGLTGFYAGWVQVGNLHALWTTPYGNSLIVKLILLAIVLIVASINLFAIERHLTRKIDEGAINVWSRRLTWTVTAELVLILGVLGAVGQMTSQEPARDVLVERSNQITVSFKDMHPQARLILAPGIAGVNHFRLEVGGPALPTDTVALIYLTMPGNDKLGTGQVTLARVAGNAFEYHGSDLSIVGDWQLQLILRQPNQNDITSTASVNLGASAPKVDVPSSPWRFKTTGPAVDAARIRRAHLRGLHGPGETPPGKRGVGDCGGGARPAAALPVTLRSDPRSRGGPGSDQSKRYPGGGTRKGCLHELLSQLSRRGSSRWRPGSGGTQSAACRLLAAAHDGPLRLRSRLLDRERLSGVGDAGLWRQADRPEHPRRPLLHQEPAEKLREIRVDSEP
jgi:copper transport protein